MKKVLKINKTLIVLGIIILISIVSFLGLYEKTNGVWSNLLPNYNLGTDLNGYRELHFTLDTAEEEKEVYVDDDGNILGFVEDGQNSKQDTSVSLVQENENSGTEVSQEENSEYKTENRTVKANEDSDKTIENFELSKQIIQKRLKTLTEFEYNIRVDSITGDLVLEAQDDENLSTAESLITSKGKFDIIDYQTGIVLLDKAELSSVNTLSNYEEGGYQLYLQITLNNNGKDKLSEISKKYVETTNEAGESSTEYIAVRFEGQTLLSTYFGEEITNGVLTIPIGNLTTDQTEYSEILEQANRIANILNEEELPLQYTLTSDNYIKSEITDEVIFTAKIVVALAILVISAILIVKFKLNGVILSITSIGYIAITALLIRYANVKITLNSIYSLIICIALNYVFIITLLNKLKEQNLKIAFVQAMKEYYLLIIPVIVISVIFTFATSVAVSSIGMTLFWGLLVGLVYNWLVVLVLKLV